MSFSITNAAQTLLSNVLSGLTGSSPQASQSPQTLQSLGQQFLQLIETSFESALGNTSGSSSSSAPGSSTTTGSSGSNSAPRTASTSNGPTFEGLTESQYITNFGKSISSASGGGQVPVDYALNAWYNSIGLSRDPGTVDPATGMVVAQNGAWLPASEVTAYNAELTARSTYLPQLQAVQAQIQKNFDAGLDSFSPVQQALIAQAAQLRTLAYASDFQPSSQLIA
ncbi:MAG: hypothetical protein JO359_06130 [Candidatus Eremiobacteraeota bacterium]|nr:hypothetical protein [Candidatus Eremiobacteraeota bacterium]